MISAISNAHLNRKTLAMILALSTTPVLANNLTQKCPEMVQDTIELSDTAKIQQIQTYTNNDTDKSKENDSRSLAMKFITGGAIFSVLGAICVAIGIIKSR